MSRAVDGSGRVVCRIRGKTLPRFIVEVYGSRRMLKEARREWQRRERLRKARNALVRLKRKRYVPKGRVLARNKTR